MVLQTQNFRVFECKSANNRILHTA